MIPAAFDEANGVADTPAGVDPDTVSPLVVYRDGEYIISCWKVTQEELADIQRTGRIWLWIKGNGMAPVALTTAHPWSNEGEPKDGEFW